LISRIKGNLNAVDGEAAYVEAGGLVYQVFVPLNIISTLAKWAGDGTREIDLHTVHYIEGGVGSGTMVPRLIGFLKQEDREFFRVFTTVRGLGVRKALRALSVPTAQLVHAIETGNRAALTRLPEIGARMADRIIAELKGKLSAFAVEAELEPEQEGDPELVEQAREILMLRLQFSRAEADSLVRSVLASNKGLKTVQELLREAFKQRHGLPVK
jgi:Holliday junction DNA helicase RuvA